MSLFGTLSLVLALVAVIVSAVTLFMANTRMNADSAAVRKSGERLRNLGNLTTFGVMLFLTLGIGTLLYGFMAADFSLQYVAQNYPDDPGPWQWLYKISGVWGGRQGSLLFWTWLIALFASWVSYHRIRVMGDRVTTVALAIMNIVIGLFIGTMLLSTSNDPFIATPAQFLGENGERIGTAALWGMNKLLEHWAMVFHPPATFIGYAGLTVPFAYAIATLIVGDESRRWVEHSNRITLFSWLLLSVGIGLGAVWAYVVLGWGGYWGWDPVENASLLSWLTGVALLHSMTVVRKRKRYQHWAIASAAITFIFVIMATFITRSGLVQSVHAFTEDRVSAFFFIAMMVLAALSAIIGLFVRKGTLGDADDISSLASKNATYYLTNVIMFAAAALLAYLTIAPALPAFLPFGGTAILPTLYNGIARPLGILLMAILAVCPLFMWGKTDKDRFFSSIKVPLIGALVLFALFMAIFVLELLPHYQDNMAQDPRQAAQLSAAGPAFYYHGMAILGFLIAAFVIAVSLYLIVLGIRARMKNADENFFAATVQLFRRAPAQAGGYLAHLGMGIILVGLIGSSMYVMDRTYALPAQTGAQLEIAGYELSYDDMDQEELANGDFLYTARFHVTHDGRDRGDITPTITVPITAGQQGMNKLDASVQTTAMEDLFVVFQGLNADGSYSVNVKVNPLILYVWIGFGVLVLGTVFAMLPRRAQPDLATVEKA